MIDYKYPCNTNYTHSYKYYRVSDGKLMYESPLTKASVLLNGFQDDVVPRDGQFIPGQHKVTAMSRIRKKFVVQSINRQADWSNGTYHYFGQLQGEVASRILSNAGGFPGANPEFGNLGERALLRAYSKIAECEVGMSENLGELRETIGMLKNPFAELRKFLLSNGKHNLGLLNAIRTYRKTGVWLGKSGRSAADAAASSWLEFRYGVMPIVNAIQDLIKLANKKANAFNPKIIRSKRAHLQHEYQRFVEGTIVTGQIEQGYGVSYTHRLAAHASVQFVQDCPQSLPDLLGLTPRFLPELAWELTRASFIVDWWLEVGTWLGAMRITPFVTVLGHTVGLKADSTAAVSEQYYRYNASSAQKKGGGAVLGSYHQESFNRTVGQHLPYLPQVNLQLSNSLFRSIDGLTLSWQFILRKLR